MVWHRSLQLMNSFNKTEAAVFSCRLCFLRAFPVISLSTDSNVIIWSPKRPMFKGHVKSHVEGLYFHARWVYGHYTASANIRPINSNPKVSSSLLSWILYCKIITFFLKTTTITFLKSSIFKLNLAPNSFKWNWQEFCILFKPKAVRKHPS